MSPAADPWLVETRQLDLSDPKLRITAQKLTQARQSLPARAAAIQAFVRGLPFSASADGHSVRASEVLRRGSGDCHSKGVLFTALCRAAGLPARLVFVDVRPRFLAGILDRGPAVLPHAVGQVLLPDGWHSTDGYVVDPVLFAHAKHLLHDHGLDSGWGIVQEAAGAWDGQGDCLQQFRAGDVVDHHGAWHEPAAFHATRPAGTRGWLGRLQYAIATRLVNLRVARVRQSRFPLPLPPMAAQP
ncbi:transglutaminase family protein [Caenimonas sedimenti]|uniref:Transglutaminase family protein n=1 Tax=Caenimonas sedimenti TaxID=2596921 RepID=A0A562ZDJ6_9BURK|nr:transglutaminase family protein [Caenimonas sedimenti]TWO64444.1 transglutaminase family protein [Caenimonas sedimenti]